MPDWVSAGFNEYAKRLPKNYQLNLIEIPTLKRVESVKLKQIVIEEGIKLLAAVPKNNLIMALDEHGKEWTTMELAQKISNWHDDGQDISLLIGGPDGLSDACRSKAQTIWSLSKLTLPHQMVKIFLAEQMYRAWSIINKHPYHRN